MANNGLHKGKVYGILKTDPKVTSGQKGPQFTGTKSVIIISKDDKTLECNNNTDSVDNTLKHVPPKNTTVYDHAYKCGSYNIQNGGCNEDEACGSVESGSTCSMEECMVRVEKVLKRSLKLKGEDNVQAEQEEEELDITQLPGFQVVPDNCPSWKRAMIEKKNMQLYEEAKREIEARKAEEEKWRDVPEWKRNLIIEKEKKKIEEIAPIEVQKRRQEEEIHRIQNMPDWKKNLLLKKKGDA